MRPEYSHNKALRSIRLLLLVVLAWAVYSSFFTVDITEYGVVRRFGHIVRIIDQPGLQFKFPFEQVLRLDKRWSHFNPPQAEYLSTDKKNLVVHSTLTWRISDPLRYLISLGNRQDAQARLSDMALARIGSVLGNYPFTALISVNTDNNKFKSVVADIQRDVAAKALAAYGIEVADVKLRQLKLPEQNKRYVFERMQAERGRIAMQYRSEGEREAQKIIAAAKRDKTQILAETYRKAEQIKGEAEATVMHLYAERFGENPEFYKFVRTLQAYEKILDDKTTLFLPADADAFRILNNDAATH